VSQVYFLHAPAVNLIKIGRSIDPDRRLAELKLLSPVDLEIMGMIDGGSLKEAELHAKFKHLHSHGEWFHATEELKLFAWLETMLCLWNKACPEARALFLADIHAPVSERSAA
jgi:hypothetical protein